MRYKVTLELQTPWWLELLRFFRIKGKRIDFELVFNENFDAFKEGDVLYGGQGTVKIVETLS